MPSMTDDLGFQLPTSPLPRVQRTPTSSDRRVLAGQLAAYDHLKRTTGAIGPDGPMWPSHEHLATNDLFDLAAHGHLEGPSSVGVGAVATAENILRERAQAGEREAMIAVAALAGDERTVRRLRAEPTVDFSESRGLMVIQRDLEAQLQGYAQHRTVFVEMAHLALDGAQNGVDAAIIEEGARRLHEAAQGGNELAARLLEQVRAIQTYRAQQTAGASIGLGLVAA